MTTDHASCLIESLRSFTEEKGYSPSFKELSERCGISVTMVHYWLSRLKHDGRVTYQPGQPRTLVLVEVSK